MDDSKSNKAFPASAAVCKFIPNTSALVTASAISSVLPFNWALKDPVVFPTCSITFLRSTDIPVLL